MRFAISIPQSAHDGAFDPAAFRRYMQRAEELGFESAWTNEQMLGTMPLFGPVETMTYAAACTERIRLGCSMLILPLYSPVHLAKSLSSLDQLSRGRLEIAVGVGGGFRMFSAFDVDPSSLVARFNESQAFTPAEKLVLRLAAALTRTPAEVDDELFAALRGEFGEPQLTELVTGIAWENYRSRFNRAFGVLAEGFSQGSFCPLPER